MKICSILSNYLQPKQNNRISFHQSAGKDCFVKSVSFHGIPFSQFLHMAEKVNLEEFKPHLDEIYRNSAKNPQKFWQHLQDLTSAYTDLTIRHKYEHLGQARSNYATIFESIVSDSRFSQVLNQDIEAREFIEDINNYKKRKLTEREIEILSKDALTPEEKTERELIEQRLIGLEEGKEGDKDIYLVDNIELLETLIKQKKFLSVFAHLISRCDDYAKCQKYASLVDMIAKHLDIKDTDPNYIQKHTVLKLLSDKIQEVYLQMTESTHQ